MKTKPIHISIEFGDAILPVIRCKDGHNRVPLKPIVEQIGVQWRSQTHKLQPGKYLFERLGIESRIVNDPTNRKAAGKERLCIRVDRVVAYLNNLNPENIGGMGNHDAAEWLKAKHQEWDNALHAYETIGVATKPDSQSKADLYRLCQVKNAARQPGQKDALDRMINDTLANLGYPVTEAQGALPL